MCITSSFTKNNYVKSSLITAAIVIIPIALTVVLGVLAAHGAFGTAPTNLMNGKILPFLTQKVGPFPIYSLLLTGAVAIGGIVTFTLSLSLLNKKKINSVEEPLLNKNKPVNENNPFNLPQYVFSKKGTIGNDHLTYYLEQKKPPNAKEIMLWSFTQRKFQSRGTRVDTQIGRRDHLPNSDLAIDSDGYAIGLSVHPISQVRFIPDENIRAVQHCERYESKQTLFNQTLTIGYYADGKCIIHQPGVRSCVYTSAAMLLIDRGVTFDLGELFETNLGNDETLQRLLKEYGYKLIQQEGSILKIAHLRGWITCNGSLLVSVDEDKIGGHMLVVDAIDTDNVTIRDPLHGWRIVVDTPYFFSMQPEFKGILPTAEKPFGSDTHNHNRVLQLSDLVHTQEVHLI